MILAARALYSRRMGLYLKSKLIRQCGYAEYALYESQAVSSSQVGAIIKRSFYGAFHFLLFFLLGVEKWLLQ